MHNADNRHDRNVITLVRSYEAATDKGEVPFLEEKAFNQLIQYYELEEQPERALEVVELAMQSYRYSVEFYARKADLLIHLHKDSLALEILAQASTFAPTDFEVNLLRAEALSNIRLHEEALLILDRLEEEASTEDLVEVYVVKALLYENQEQYEQMFLVLKAALDIDPEHQGALEGMWNCVEASKRYQESAELHQQLIDRAPYSYLAWYNLGHAQAYLSNYAEAAEAFEYAFIINERFEYAYREYGELCFELQSYDKALKCYLEMMEHFDIDGDLLLRIGQCYQHKQEYTTACRYFRRALQFDNMNDEVLFHIGECYAFEERWPNAIYYYQRALQIEDQREEYYASLGEAFFHLERFEEAEANFIEATQIAPEESRYWLQYASFLMEIGRSDDTIELLEEADYHAPGAEINYCRIACLFAMGKRQEAIYWLGEALAEDFEYHPTLFDFIPELELDPDVLTLISTYH